MYEVLGVVSLLVLMLWSLAAIPRADRDRDRLSDEAIRNVTGRRRHEL